MDEDAGGDKYNYRKAAKLKQACKSWIEKGELRGPGVLLRDGDSIFHTCSTYRGGLDLFLNPYSFLDVKPLGRREDREPYVMTWVRIHDPYSA